MIEVKFNRGLYLPEMDFWLDPWDARDEAFVSHAHADHFSRHGKALCSTVTAGLLRARFNMAEARLEAMDFGDIIERNGFRLRMLPAGHIVGSAMLHVTRIKDGATLLYTGDFKAKKGRTTEAVNFIQADTLIMETTFGLPHLVFPAPMEVDAALLRFVHDAFADGETPVVFGYSLGKAQEAIALLAENGIPVLSHPKVAEMTQACRAAGVNLPEPVVFEGFSREGHVVVAPPNAVKAKLLRGLKDKRTAMLTGWALQSGAFYRYRVGVVIPMSDHADHPGLMECVMRVRPKRVLTVHGFAKEFAAELREKGIEAWCASGGDQLELSLGKKTSPSVGVGLPRQTRPVCELADFSDVCRLIGETSSRLAKVEYLVNYLRKLEDDKSLEIATRWFTGEALPRRAGHRVLKVGAAGIKRSLLSVPGVRADRYKELSTIQNDISRTARALLQEVVSPSNPFTISGLKEFFLNLTNKEESLAKMEALSKQLFDLHPVEAETVIKLLTGDLRIGLKDGLVEEAVGVVFEADPAEISRVNMLTGDLGRTAVMAKNGGLAEARLTPLVPIRCMLASPLEREKESDGLVFSNLRFKRPLWLEPKHDGIRAQLHKCGDEIGLFSRDLRPLDQAFPELIEEAKKLEGDFVLDGELIAYAEGRKLGFADLQKRLGRKRVEGDLFMESKDGAASVPLKYVAFDLLWLEGEELLEVPLRDRRARLESRGLEGMFDVIDLIRADSDEEVERCFKRSLQDEHEGLIAKDPESFYVPGRRGKSWMKLKGVMPTLDCVVVFAEQGHGRRSDVLSDYTFSVKDEVSGELKVLGKAYSGLTDLEIEELTEHFMKHTISRERRKRKVKPNVVLEIAFDSIRKSSRHDSGLALRFPRIKAIRRDKGVDDIDTLSTAEGLLDM
ncbi:MAG: ATP-dependent DNA ligase [Luteolibacter sp.]